MWERKRQAEDRHTQRARQRGTERLSQAKEDLCTAEIFKKINYERETWTHETEGER